MTTLKITHNAGILSCYSKRLEGIVWFFNAYKYLPDRVDSSEQFSLYKSNPSEDITSLYIKEIPKEHRNIRPVVFYNDMQFLDYRGIDFARLDPFIALYFTPSDHVASIVSLYEKKYAIEYKNTCAVFYRGNDKSTETTIASYESFISQARKIKEQFSDVLFLVQTDETEFLELFEKEFPGAVHFEEVPHIRKQQSTVHDELPLEERAEFGARFLAATLVLSKCEHLITHSGNCGLWAVLYRGNSNGVYQWLNGSWGRSWIERLYLWIKIQYKKTLRKIIKGNIGWKVVAE
ncbi:MAG TPA: hypothetical protein VGE18_00255 [Candidatus Paceibacterota bacterium]